MTGTPWHDNLQGRAWRKTWRKVQRKSAAKSEAKNAGKNATAEKQLFGIYHGSFHFGLGTLFAIRFLDPFLAVSQALFQRSATHRRT